MKKYFIIAAAITALVACQKNEVKTIAPEVDNAIGFSAYTGTAVTKGKQAEADSIKGTKDKPGPGIGVFAFYQPAVGGAKSNFTTRKYATPDYMYNQQVKVDFTVEPNKWTYSPIKYWPNNADDQLSFFAYAPYKETTTWEDFNINTDINGTVLTQTFSIDPDPVSQIDLLFTAPQLNLTKQKVADKITFQFAHVLSQINLQVGVEQNKNEKKPTGWGDINTEIVVNSIAFNGVYDTYTYKYTTGTTPSEAWTASGSQNVVMTSANFQNNKSTDWTAVSDNFYDLTKEGSTLFLAPQKDIEIVINYTVTTTDAKLPGGKSVVNNVITKKLSEITTLTDGFEAGNAYILKFLIGMNQVTLSAEVADWNDVEAQQIDVPANL